MQKLNPLPRDAEFPKLIDQDPEVWSVRWSSPSVSTDFGFLAAYAAEMGDDRTRRILLDYADRTFRPVTANGRYYYPRHDVETGSAPIQVSGQESVGPFPATRQPEALNPEQFGQHLVGPLTGNALLAFSRLNPGGGLWATYNDLGATYGKGDPELVGVAYPKVLVTQAFYDRPMKRLAIALEPGTEDRGAITFAIRHLDRSATYAISVDGKQVARGEGARLQSSDAAIRLAWSGSGDLTVAATLGSGRQVTIDRVDERRADRGERPVPG